jgi:2,3-bisphosphoglycerate-dependent phosphoglycerate mutase
MRTTVYFIRHAQPDFSVREDAVRPLSAKGKLDAESLVGCFAGIPIDHVYSSPFLRAVDTVRPLAVQRGLPIERVEAFRERKVDAGWIEDFHAFARRQWADFQYKLTDGECLAEVQARNVGALAEVLKRHPGGSLVIGTHGTALSTMLHHLDPSYGYDWFERIRTVMPLVVKVVFGDSKEADIMVMTQETA